MIFTALFALLFYISILLFFFQGVRKIIKGTSSAVPVDSPQSVCIVIPVRNEETSIAACLNSILAGSNSTYFKQVIVIDDESTDKTVSIVNKISTLDSRVTLHSVTDFPAFQVIKSPKKRAILCGIELAEFNWIALTDGDCIVGPDWLKSMTEKISENTWMVGGPVEFSPVNSWFSRWMHTEFAGFMLVAAGSVGMKRPTTINGANLLISVEGFKQTGGYSLTGSIISGDDELLMQQFHRYSPGSVSYSLSASSCVKTQPPENFQTWINQRLRWASKTTDYPSIWYKLFLAAFWLCHAIFLVSFPVAILNSSWSLGGILLLKILADYFFLRQSNSLFLQHPVSFFTVLWTEIPQIFYSVLTGFLGLRKRFVWKGRAY